MILGGSGIELFRHICQSHKINNTSILQIPHCETDQSAKVVDNCCGIEEFIITETYCCDEETSSPKNEISFNSAEKCCESFSELKKIEEFLYPPIDKKLIIGLTNFIILPTSELTNNSSSKRIDFQNKDLPPPLFGRTLLNSIHQLKIDTLIS